VSRSRWLARLILFLKMLLTGIRRGEVGQVAPPSQAAEMEKNFFVEFGGALEQNEP
jgi:hypothetical protein